VSAEDQVDQISDDLRDLIAHPGWALVLRHIEQEWGAARILDRQHKEADPMKWPQYHAISAALDELVSWPSREISDLSAAATCAAVKPPLIPRRA